MSFPEVLRNKFERSVGLFEELVSSLSEDTLQEALPSLPSNTIGAQIWCVVGARESHARAIEAGGWAGFSCSLSAEDVTKRERLRDALAKSGSKIVELLGGADSFTDEQHRLALDLLEHEAAHQGQLIRYLFGLRLTIPPGWKSRYALQ